MDLTEGEEFLIVGLGNPGASYRDTRHNLGSRVLETWAGRLGIGFKAHRFQGLHARFFLEGKAINVLCPQTFMNRSGVAIRACKAYFRVPLARVLVVHDDLDLPLGRIKAVPMGGAGGHKGISSAQEHLGSDAFMRLKLGIGRPEHREGIETYVLSPFYPEEREEVERVIDAAIDACRAIVSGGIQRAMNHINRKPISMKEERNLCRD